MKKLFALFLAIAMMATLSVTAFAADYDTAGDKGMNVTYSVAPAYTVTIPETVTIGADGTEKTVSAEDVVVNKGQYVSVTLAADNNFTVKTTEGAELTYTVTANGENIAAGGFGRSNSALVHSKEESKRKSPIRTYSSRIGISNSRIARI